MTIDEEKVDYCTTYTFKKAGNHTVRVLMDLSSLSSLNNMFSKAEFTSIIFSEKFNTETIVYMNSMFRYCKKLTSI